MNYILLLFFINFISIQYFVNAADANGIKKRELSPITIDTKECGTKKNCFISPSNCDSNNHLCNYVLKWDYDGHNINYELKAITKGWINILFSEDKVVGNDNVVVCMRASNNENTILIQHYYKNTAQSELELIPVNDGLSNKDGYFKDGSIYCKFSRAKTSGIKNVNNLNKGNYIYVGTGAPDELINANLNSQTFKLTDSPIEFYTINKSHEPTNWLVKFHAIIMLIAWIFLSSLGILIARYYKPLWPNHALFKLRVWFSFHRSLMLTVFALTILGFVLILIHMGLKWSHDGMEFVHSILGIIVICLVVINPILGFCRPKPESGLRCLFFWFHWLIGTVAYCLSVPAIFIGMDLRKIDLPNWCSWLLFFWVIFHIIVEIILEVHYCCTFHKHTERYTEYTLIDKTKIIDKRGNPPGYRWKPTLLFIYAAVTAIVVCSIVIAILIKDFI